MPWYWIVLIVLAVLWLLTILVYWFDLDNKLIYNVVRPMMKKGYDKKKRDVRL